MATRPLAFGVRFRNGGRTVQVRPDPKRPQRYVLEDRRSGRREKRREHTSLAGALRDFARTWRGRLH